MTLRSILLLGSVAIACALPATTRAENSPDALDEAAVRHAQAPAPAAPRAWWWRDGAARLQTLLRDPKRPARADDPDWLRYRSGSDLVEARLAAGDGDVCLVLQQDRPDGTDLLTARYTLHDGGAVRTYAGGGVNRAQYFHDDPDQPGPTKFSGRNRSTSMGAAAELGSVAIACASTRTCVGPTSTGAREPCAANTARSQPTR